MAAKKRFRDITLRDILLAKPVVGGLWLIYSVLIYQMLDHYGGFPDLDKPAQWVTYGIWLALYGVISWLAWRRFFGEKQENPDSADRAP
ncbi:MAG: hypothetical protein ACPGOY_02310 [Rhodospirillaceae bacterium]